MALKKSCTEWPFYFYLPTFIWPFYGCEDLYINVAKKAYARLNIYLCFLHRWGGWGCGWGYLQMNRSFPYCGANQGVSQWDLNNSFWVIFHLFTWVSLTSWVRISSAADVLGPFHRFGFWVLISARLILQNK